MKILGRRYIETGGSSTLVVLVLMIITSWGHVNAQLTSSFIENSTGCNWPWSAVAYHPTTNVLYGFYNIGDTYKLVKWNANGTNRTALGSFTAANAGTGTGSGSAWGASDDVDIAVGSNGHIHVTFRMGGTGACCSQPRGVFYAKSIDDGSTWTFTKIQTYTNPNGWLNTDDPLVRLDGSNNPHIAFHYSDANNPREYAIKYTMFNGTSWSAVENAFSQTGGTNSSNEITDFGFDLDGSNKPHVAFQRETNDGGCDGGLWYTNKTSGTWSSPTELQHGSGSCGSSIVYGYNPNVEIDASNKVHIVSSNYQDKIYHSTNASGSWIHTQINGNLTGTVRSHSFHINGSGHKIVAYNSGNLKYAYQSSGGGAWSTGTIFSTAGGPPYAVTMNNNTQVMALVDKVPASGSCSSSNHRRLFQSTGSLSACTNPTVPVLSGGGTICPGTSSTLSLTGTLNDATTWSWYSGSCGGASAGTGTSISVSPGSTTTYYARGTGGCVSGGACGSVTVTVADNSNPVITCPANISVNIDAGLCSAIVNYTVPVGTDNCPGATTAQTAGLGSGSAFPVGTTTETYVVTDGSGNMAQCSFTVTVSDNENPSITCPGNITVNNDAGLCSAIVNYTVPVGTDNCPGATTAQTVGLGSGSVFPVGTTTETYVVTDAAGNVAQCSFTVTVSDSENPVIACPVNIAVNNDAGLCSAVVTYTAPVGTDNCPGATTAQTVGLGSGSAFPVGTTTETYQVTDAAGNKAQCSFTVTVSDSENPVIVCPANIAVNNDAGLCSAVVSYAVPVGADNCPGSTTAQTVGLGSGSAFPVGTTTETYVVTDAAGNLAQCSFTVTVTDNENPTINCPADVTMIADSNCEVTYIGPTATFGDNCSGSVLTASPSLPVTFSGQGVHTITYDVLDAHGNANSCTQEITVISSIVPEAGPDQTVIVNTGSGPVPLPCVTLIASATGGAGGYSYAWSPAAGLSSTTTATTTACPAVTTVYYVTITDAGGCFEVDSLTVTVVDINDPELPTVGNNKNKIYVCHVATCTTLEVNANANCNSPSSLCYHLTHGDQLGVCTCNNDYAVDESSEPSFVAFPNPFNWATTIEFVENQSGSISLDIYDMKGALVQKLYEGVVVAGQQYEFMFDANSLAQQMYIARLTTKDNIKHLKLLFVK